MSAVCKHCHQPIVKKKARCPDCGGSWVRKRYATAWECRKRGCGCRFEVVNGVSIKPQRRDKQRETVLHLVRLMERG